MLAIYRVIDPAELRIFDNRHRIASQFRGYPISASVVRQPDNSRSRRRLRHARIRLGAAICAVRNAGAAAINVLSRGFLDKSCVTSWVATRFPSRPPRAPRGPARRSGYTLLGKRRPLRALRSQPCLLGSFGDFQNGRRRNPEPQATAALGETEKPLTKNKAAADPGIAVQGSGERRDTFLGNISPRQVIISLDTPI